MGAWLAICDAVEARKTGRLALGTVAYVTKGGTYVVASSGEWNDGGQQRDLLAILPAPLEGSRVVVLQLTVNPDVVAALRERLDEEAGR